MPAMAAAAHVTDDAPARFEAARAELARDRRRRTIACAGVFALLLAGSAWVGEVRLDHLYEGLPGLFDYIGRTMPVLRAESLGADIEEWYWGFGKWLALLGDTILIAYVATALGTVGGVGLAFLAADNLVASKSLRFAVRRSLEVARAVPELVWAMMFVFAFGIGPIAGVLAIAVHSVGALGKLFSEVVENIDMRPVEAVRATGAGWMQTVRYAVVPQVLPNFSSYALLRFEINVRGATVIGFVGAGGIGQELMFVIGQYVYGDISAIVLMIIATVTLIDLTCERIRHRFIDPRAAG